MHKKMAAYKKQRLKRFEGNRARIEAMGLTTMANSLTGSVQNDKKKSRKSRSTESVRMSKRKIDDNYRPVEDDELQGLSSTTEEDDVDDGNEELTIPQKTQLIALRNRSNTPSSSNGEGPNNQDHSETIARRKTRGKNRCKQIWQLDDGKRIRIKCNNHGQPIGDGSVDLATCLGLVARMGYYCSIAKNDWRHIIKDDHTKEKFISYLKEHYIFPDDKIKYEKCIHYVLRSIGEKWRNYKYDLRKKITKYVEEGKSKEEIHAIVLKEVEDTQWIDFVNNSLSKEAKAKSDQAKKNRSKQIEFHTLGRQSYAQKENAMDECESLKKQRISLGVDVIDLENEIIHEVRGLEHSGRVRGAGRGPTPLSFLGSRRHGMSNDLTSLLAEVQNLKKRDEEREAQLVVERANMEAQLVAEWAKHDKTEAHLNKLQQMLDLYLSRS